MERQIIKDRLGVHPANTPISDDKMKRIVRIRALRRRLSSSSLLKTDFTFSFMLLKRKTRPKSTASEKVKLCLRSLAREIGLAFVEEGRDPFLEVVGPARFKLAFRLEIELCAKVVSERGVHHPLDASV